MHGKEHEIVEKLSLFRQEQSKQAILGQKTKPKLKLGK